MSFQRITSFLSHFAINIFSDQYVALLRELMPVERWPQVRPSWTRLINRIGLARHPTYQNFVYHFGRSEAMKFYQKHVNEAREYWMQRR